MEAQKKKSQSKLTRTKSSLLRVSSPTTRSSVLSLSSVNEDDFRDEEEEDDKNKKRKKNNNNSNSKKKKKKNRLVRPGSIRFISKPVLAFFSVCSLFLYLFYFFYLGTGVAGPTSENVLLILIFVAVALYVLNRNKNVIHRSVSVLKHSWDGNLKRLGFCTKGSDKPVQWFIGETGSGVLKEEKVVQKEGVEFYSNGDFYEGEFHGGKCNGSGVYHYFASGRYEGDWVDGKYDGYGIESWARGSRYKG